MHYIFSRNPRDLPSLFGQIDRIEQPSRARRQRWTIPFLRRLEEMSTEETG